MRLQIALNISLAVARLDIILLSTNKRCCYLPRCGTSLKRRDWGNAFVQILSMANPRPLCYCEVWQLCCLAFRVYDRRVGISTLVSSSPARNETRCGELAWRRRICLEERHWWLRWEFLNQARRRASQYYLWNTIRWRIPLTVGENAYMLDRPEDQCQLGWL